MSAEALSNEGHEEVHHEHDQGRFGGPGGAREGKARKGTTKYCLGVLEYRTKYCPRVAGYDVSPT